MINPDIDEIIFHCLPMTDKHSYLRTCKSINRFSIQMPEIEARFHRMLNDTSFFHISYYSCLSAPLYKFAVELVFDGHPIPDKYIITENRMLHQFPKIYKILVERGHTSTVTKMLNLDRNSYMDANIGPAICGAVKARNIEFLKYLHEYGCAALDGEHPFDGRAIGVAAKAGDLETLKWLVKYGATLTDSTVTHAAEGGSIRVLEYLIDKGCKIMNASYFAAKKNQFEIVRYLHSIYPKSLSHAAYGAAMSGHLEMLKFAFSHGHRLSESFWSGHLHIWKWLIENNHFEYNIETIKNIAWSGNLESLQYVHSKGYNVLDKKVFKKAISSRNIKMVRWLREMGCDEGSLNSVFKAALDAPSTEDTTGGSLPILKLLVSWGYDLIGSDCTISACYGDLDILQYQYAHGCKLDKRVISHAAESGHLHVIIWCRKQRCEWDAQACKKTVFWNHLNVLKWLRGIDRDKCGFESDETEICPWDRGVCLQAIKWNHIDILVFALLNGCDFDEFCFETALESQNADIISYVTKYYEILRSPIVK